LTLVARVPKSEVTEGTLLRLPHPPFDVVVTLIDGVPYALEDACNHAGASLTEGGIEGDRIMCPMHGYVFDMKSGELISPRGLCDAQRTFRVESEGDTFAIYDDFTIAITGLKL
jgi:nitrite reductase/ring-hydroxylating ferredoxin subunit